MNKIYPTILAVLISITAIAAERPRQSILTISMYENSDMRVQIDGRSYNERDNEFTISNIQPGYHSIQVYSLTSNRVFGGIFGKSREKLMYSSNLYVKPGQEVELFINRNGKAKIRETDLSRNGRGNDRNRDDRWKNEDDDKWNDRDRPDRNGNNGGYSNSVSYQEFQSMRETLRRERFENTRMGLAQQMFDRNTFKAEQVRELLQMFTFENYKLDLAKYAYRNTVDRNNYHLIYDVFSHNSSKQELARFISSYR